MRTIAPLTFTFVYISTPTSETCVRSAYRRLLAIAERNLIAKGLLGPAIHNDIEIMEKHIVDNNRSSNYSGTNDSRGIFNSSGSGSKTEAFERDDFSDGEKRRHSSCQGGNGLAGKQSLYNRSIQSSEPK
mgnify:CR=1 FL=1